MNALRKAMRRRGWEYVVALTALVNLLGAAGMYAFERAQETEGGFSSYGDALWWTSMLLAGYPRHRDSLIALATIERDHGHLAEAERHAAAALALDPRRTATQPWPFAVAVSFAPRPAEGCSDQG